MSERIEAVVNILKQRYEIKNKEDAITFKIKDAEWGISHSIIHEVYGSKKTPEAVADYFLNQIEELEVNNFKNMSTWDEVKEAIILVPFYKGEADRAEVKTLETDFPITAFGLIAALAINNVHSMMFVPEDKFDTWGVSDKEAYDQAMLNITRRLVLLDMSETLTQAGKIKDLSMASPVDESDIDIASSLVFTFTEQYLNENYPQGAMISAPTRDRLAVAPFNDDASLFLCFFHSSSRNQAPRYKKFKDVIGYKNGNWGEFKYDGET